MRMSAGVEWAAHTCLYLTWTAPEAIAVRKLAAYHELPSAYLNKQLQALCRTGILESITGPRGGFRLARPPESVTLMDIVASIEGPDNAFVCGEIRQRGPDGGPPEKFPHDCAIKQFMGSAELAWRRELAAHTIADAKAVVERQSPHVPELVRTWFHS